MGNSLQYVRAHHRQAGGEGFVDASSRQIIGRRFPHTVLLLAESPNPPESPNVRMSAPLLITEGPCEVRVDEPRGLDTVAPSSAMPAAHVLDWNAATWEDRSHGTRPQPSVPASIRERSECERRQPTRSGTRSWFATGPLGLTSRRRVRVAKWPCLVHAHAHWHRVPPPPAGRPLLRSAAWWEGGEVGGAWRARESQPGRQVVPQTRIAQGREGALTRLQVSATLEGPVCRG